MRENDERGITMKNPYVHPKTLSNGEHMLNQASYDGYSFDEKDEDDLVDKYDRRKEIAVEAFKIKSRAEMECDGGLTPPRQVVDIKEDHNRAESEIFIIYKYPSTVCPNSDTIYHMANSEQLYLEVYDVTDTQLSTKTDAEVFPADIRDTSIIEDEITNFYELYGITEGESSKEMLKRLNYINFSNDTLSINGPNDSYSKVVFDDGGRFEANYNVMIEVHELEGHPDKDIVLARTLEACTLTYRDKDNNTKIQIINKGEEMHVDGSRILNVPLDSFENAIAELSDGSMTW